ncbi:MAG: alpha-glucosidase [Caldilineaceae bacterium]|nr:alpha-glucosidase [Caldilineaceae bacterium]
MSKQWWKEAVAYQIYPRSFYDSDGDGIGDLRGVIEKLDYLQTLGVDLLWLTPFFASPQVDNGYDISDYQAIDPPFGTMDDMDGLIKAAHERGLRILIDLVINHTSDQHPWFSESRQSKENPYRDFYIWRDGKDGREPNNWKAHFSQSAWTYDARTDQYYLHTFSPQQPDLNWQNPEMRAALRRMISWWVDKGVDGFRLDAISFISKPDGLPDNPGTEPYIFNRGNMMHGPDYHAYLHELNREVTGRSNTVTVGECIDLTVETAIEVAAPAREELNMPFLFEHTDYVIEHGMDVRKLKEIIARWQAGLHGKAWIGLAFNSHDLPRVVSLFGDDTRYRIESAKLFGTLLLTLQGTPFIYQGEEIGMTNMRFPSLTDYRDLAAFNSYREMTEEQGISPAAALAYLHAAGRDNSRTPMQWDATRNAGFTSGEPWIMVNPNYETINVAQAMGDPTSVFTYYQRLIALRKQHPALIYGRFDLFLPEHPTLFVYTRTFMGKQFLIVLNISDEIEPWEGTESYAALCNSAQIILSNYVMTGSTLQPYEARIYQKSASIG